MYRNYCENQENAIENYHKLLQLDNIKSVKEIYESCGIKFDFSEQYLQKLPNFAKSKINEWEK